MVNYRNVVKTVAKRYPAVKKRYNIYYPAVRQLGKDLMYLKGLINSEGHYHIVQSANNFSNLGIVVSLSDVPQGDTEINRTGNVILPSYINIQLMLGATNAASTPQVVRYILFKYWGETTSAATPLATASEILSTTLTSYAPYSQLNPDNVGSRGDRTRRIEVLKSGFYVFDLVSKRQIAKKINIKLNTGQVKEHIRFVDGTTAQPCSGGLYLLFISDDASSNSKYQFSSKLVFHDN